MTTRRSRDRRLAGVDPDELARHIARMYRDVANEAVHDLHFHTGRGLAEALGYPAGLLDRLPARRGELVRGGRLSPRSREPGRRASACWTSAAARAWTSSRPPWRWVRAGRSPAWTSRPSSSPRPSACGADEHVTFRHARIEELPFGDASFDAVISNGVVNLSADKPAVFAEVGPRAATGRAARARRHRHAARDRPAHRGPARPLGRLHRRAPASGIATCTTSRPPAWSCARSGATAPTASPASGRSAPATSTAPTRSSCSRSSRAEEVSK